MSSTMSIATPMTRNTAGRNCARANAYGFARRISPRSRRSSGAPAGCSEGAGSLATEIQCRPKSSWGRPFAPCLSRSRSVTSQRRDSAVSATRSAERRFADRRSVSWKYTWTYAGKAPKAARAAMPSEWVAGSSSRRSPPGSESHAGRSAESRGSLSARYAGTNAVPVQSAYPSSASTWATPRSMYQPPPQNSRGSSPCSRSHRASRRTRSACSSPPAVGRACAGPTKCVWCPSGPWLAASRARSSHSSESSPAPSSGGRSSAAIANPPGRRACSDTSRSQHSPSRGRSTWQETTAYRFCSVCGICGFLAPSGEPNTALVEEMNAALFHRGPDEGSVDAFGRCVLGNRRLQVIDLVTGSQPVENETGDVVCVFNGEIYNFYELRDELAKSGHEIRGTGDTPVIPHLYEEHGTAFAEHLFGMFTVALWDRGRERLVLARDRVGKKPLLWTRLADGGLAFASELKALLRLPGVSREVDPHAVDAFLALQYVPGGTGLVGVEKLPPGHVLVAEDGDVRVERYARLGQLGPESEGDWLALVRERVEAAVRRRLISDVPLGALLSGGIDSSIVVALMAQASTQPVRTFTV